jgi:DNA-binding NarL/FixJ family response regulator
MILHAQAPVVTGVPKTCYRCGRDFTDFSDRAMQRICAQCRRPKPQSPRYSSSLLLGKELTTREKQVLDRVAAGDVNKEIGQLLRLGEGTIKVMVSTILAKTGKDNRTKLAVWWVLKAWNASVMPEK